MLRIGYPVAALADYVMFLFKIFDFYVKSYTFVKFGNLATNSKEKEK